MPQTDKTPSADTDSAVLQQQNNLDWPAQMDDLRIPAPSADFRTRILAVSQSLNQAQYGDDWRELLRLFSLPKPALSLGGAMAFGLLLGWQINLDDFSLLQTDSSIGQTSPEVIVIQDSIVPWTDLNFNDTGLL